MTEEEKKQHVKSKDEPIFVPKSASDRQRLHVERLMKNPEKPVFIPEVRKQWKPREPPEFVRDVMGSSAGAGSGEFHVYRGYRRREQVRQDFIDGQNEKDEKEAEFQKKLQENEKQAEERTAKKRAKRNKKKLNAKLKKQKLEESTKEDDEEEEEEEEENTGEETCFVIGGR
ncbi:PRKR-interacting protein 1 homolog [Anneissia japonica]|uniref:PRKR-interacting protein 1 homolog n=1 Tax=Anneissia japonica TaxID=1529436 RepID=UPI0014254D75|nr:PRKR-interacting protein 1 homolog [Anneissia japonica]